MYAVLVCVYVCVCVIAREKKPSREIILPSSAYKDNLNQDQDQTKT